MLKQNIGDNLFKFSKPDEPGDIYSLEEDFYVHNEKYVGIYGSENNDYIIAVKRKWLDKLYKRHKEAIDMFVLSDDKRHKEAIDMLVLSDDQMKGIDDCEWYQRYENAAMYMIQLIVPSQTNYYCMDLIRFIAEKKEKETK